MATRFKRNQHNSIISHTFTTLLVISAKVNKKYGFMQDLKRFFYLLCLLC